MRSSSFSRLPLPVLVLGMLPGLLAAGVGCSAHTDDASTSESGVVESQTASSPKIRVTDGIPAWHDSFRANVANLPNAEVDGYTACAEVEELPDAYLCTSMSIRHLNEATLRARLFLEGLYDNPGTVVSLSSFPYRHNVDGVSHEWWGYTFRASDFKRFWTALNAKCLAEETPDFCPTLREQELFEYVNRPDAPADFVLMAYAFEPFTNEHLVDYFGSDELGFNPWAFGPAQEILHAQYFLDPEYRRIADEHWNNTLSEEERDFAITWLGLVPLTGETSAETWAIARREYQAWALTPGVDDPNVLGDFHLFEKRDQLRTELVQQGYSPIHVVLR